MQTVFNDRDYELFEKLVSSTQENLHKAMQIYLKSEYKKVIVTKDYIVAIGDIPIALVAHMDTVFKTPVRDLYYDKKKGILWSPDGLGADDRAGVFAIIRIIESGLHPSIILTTDEEVGCLGSEALSKVECPIHNLKYLIQLDRCNSNDCVFYSCANDNFIDYVSSFGFIEQIGSFSDISMLMPAWNKCGVNLSVGYRNEHSEIETLHVGSLFSTIDKVKKMLSEKNIPNFEYTEDSPYTATFYKYLFGENAEDNWIKCDKCGKYFPEYDTFPVKTSSGKEKYYCADCITEGVNWCPRCHCAYETEGNDKLLCIDCQEAVKV